MSGYAIDEMSFADRGPKVLVSRAEARRPAREAAVSTAELPPLVQVQTLVPRHELVPACCLVTHPQLP